MARQHPVVDLVRAVIERLERLGVQQTHEEVKRAVVVGNHRVERTLLLAQRVEIYIVMVRNGLDLRQIERREAHGGGHQDRLRGFACCLLSRTFSSCSQNIHDFRRL